MKASFVFSGIMLLTAAAFAQADPIVFQSVTGTGTVAGTDITYTVTSDAASQDVFLVSAGHSDNSLFSTPDSIYGYVDDYPGAHMTTTITFSQAVEARYVLAMINEMIGGGSSIGEYAAISVSGGTATTNSFNVQDAAGSLFHDGSNIFYNPTNGQFGNGTTSYGSSIIIGSTSTDTLTTLDIYVQQPSYGFAEAIGVNPSAVPEPSSMVMCGIAGLMGSASAWRRRKRAATA